MANELFPIITTADLERALGFWRDMLGGRVTYEFRDPASGSVGYVGLDVGVSHLGIGVASQPLAAPEERRPISLWVYVDDCDVVVARVRSSGGTITEEPADQPWGERVARVLDPDGNEVIVGAKAAADTQP